MIDVSKIIGGVLQNRQLKCLSKDEMKQQKLNSMRGFKKDHNPNDSPDYKQKL